MTAEAASEAIGHYARSRQVELARSIEARAKIYLDLRFWIRAREAALGNPATDSEKELLRLLRQGVASGKLVCPVSESTFMELMKQEHTASRRMATASIIDELSLGVTLVPIDVRIGTEIAHFFHANASSAELYPVTELVWSKLTYVLGFLHPSLPDLDPDTEFHVQKIIFDEIWSKTLSEMVGMIGDVPLPEPDRFDRLAADLNKNNASHADELKSFPQTYKTEIAGAIDACGDIAAEAICAMAARANVAPPAPESPEWRALANKCKNLLVVAFTKDATKMALRTMHIQACLHANLRWNKGRQFEANDFHDFNHAAAALGYCDAFFTERSLCALATAKNTSLEAINGCRVTDNFEEAVKILEGLCGS